MAVMATMTHPYFKLRWLPPTLCGERDHLQSLFISFATRSSATAKSTARPPCLVGVLYDIYRETNNRSTANQPLVRNWP